MKGKILKYNRQTGEGIVSVGGIKFTANIQPENPRAITNSMTGNNFHREALLDNQPPITIEPIPKEMVYIQRP